jgi:hypothetical protein
MKQQTIIMMWNKIPKYLEHKPNDIMSNLVSNSFSNKKT